MRKTYYVYVTAPLQLSDAEAGIVFGRKLDRSWLSPSGTAEGHFGFTRAKLHISVA